MNLLMNGTFTFANGCYFNFIPGSSMIYLASDDTKTWLPVQLGTAQTASNSQCTLTGTGGSAITAGNSITVTLPLSFSTTKFGGLRTVWAYAMDQEALASGWKSLATFTVQ